MEQIGAREEILNDVHIKEIRLREFMQKEDLDAVILNRQDNFAWFTCGGDNRVITTSESGFAFLVITATQKWIVAHSIDLQRFMEEQVEGQGFEPVSLLWFEGAPLDKALELVRGQKVAADVPAPGTRYLGSEITALHTPFTDLELHRLRWVGKTSHKLLTKVAGEILPGMSEMEIAARIQEAYTQQGLTVDVLIVGVDERISRYRHPLPTQRVLEKYALLHPAGRRWGLHANVTRLVHFGQPTEEIQRAVNGVLTIEGRIMGMLSDGMRYADILTAQKQWYAEVGFPDDWKYHFQGGTTGYTLADPTHSLKAVATVRNRMAFDYFVTITGAKAENLSLLTADGLEIVSKGDDWPVKTVQNPSGMIEVPDMLIR